LNNFLHVYGEEHRTWKQVSPQFENETV